MSRTFHWMLLTCIVVALGSATLEAQQKAKPADEQPVVKVYRVIDLVLPAPNYPYEGTYLPAMRDTGPRILSGAGTGGMGGGMMGGMGGTGGGMGGMFQIPDHLAQVAPGVKAGESSIPARGGARAIDMDQLIETITATVEPDSWEVNARGEGTISPIGGAIAVRQTPAIHAKVQEFLEAVKRESGTLRTLTIAARWLMLDSAHLAQLRGKADGDKPGAAGETIDSKALAALPSEAQRFAGQITCFNGQTVHLISGRMETVINGAIPVIGAAVGYQPVMLSPHLGALLQITPSALPGNDGVLVDLHSSITRWGKPDKRARLGTTPASDVTLDVDRINVAVQQFATSLRMPLDKAVIVGGITFPDNDEGAQPAGAAKPPENEKRLGLYLVLEIHSSAEQ